MRINETFEITIPRYKRCLGIGEDPWAYDHIREIRAISISKDMNVIIHENIFEVSKYTGSGRQIGCNYKVNRYNPDDFQIFFQNETNWIEDI